MNENNRKVSKQFILLVIFALIVTVFIKCFQEKIFSQKYFADSYQILFNMAGRGETDSTYTFTANFYNAINFLGFSSLKEWRYFITFIFFPITIYNIWRGREYSDFDYIFILLSIILIDIYVFNLSKDLIQYIIFLIMALILSQKKATNEKKLIELCIVLIIESLNFRVYYLLLAILIVTFYFLDILISRKSLLKFTIIALITFFFEVFVLSILSPDNYDSLINARHSVNIFRDQEINAVTMINDPLGQNTNFLKFIGNYTINFVRFLFPIELLLKGPKYLGFMLYQLVIVKYLNTYIKYIKSDNILIFFVFVGYIMVSVIFEPDFGSLVRHEAAALPILLLLIQVNNQNTEQL